MEIVLQTAYSAGFYTVAIVMLQKLYVRKNVNLILFLSVVAGAVSIMTLISIFNIPGLNFAYSILSVLALNKLFYHCKGKLFILYDTILVLIMLVLEMLATLVLSFTLNMTIDAVLLNFWYRAAAMFFYWILMFVAFRIFIFFVQLHNITILKTMELMFFLVLTAGELFFLHYINSFLIRTSAHYEFAVIVALFLGIDIYFTYLIYKTSKTYELENELELVKQQSRLQLNAYKNLNAKYDSSKKIIHDARKHISALEGLIDADYTDSAKKYAGLLYAELDKLEPEFKCDSPILSVIINNKLDEAANLGIKFELDVQYSELSFMTEKDITTVFANLLDNAFEATESLPNNDKYVKLIILRHHDFIIINVSNNFQNVNQSDDGGFSSTKEGHQGIGLISIRNVIENYNGTFISELHEQRFVTKITIPNPISSQ